MSNPVYKSGVQAIHVPRHDYPKWYGAGKVGNKSFWKSLRGIGFSTGYTYKQMERLDDALDKVIKNGYNFIRMWHVWDYEHHILQHIHDRKLDLKVQIGIDIAHDSEAHQKIDAAVAFARQYPEQVVGFSVGNERMWWGGGHITAEMALAHATYAKQVYGAPVTYDFVVESITHASGRARKVVDFCAGLDYLSVHMYGGSYYHGHRDNPSWTPDKQIEAVHTEAQGVQDRVGHLGLPVVIGETGWQSRMYAAATVAHEQEYYNKMIKHVYGDGDALIQSMIYFELADEHWKGGDDAWGIYDEGGWDHIGDGNGAPKFSPTNVDEVLAQYKNLPTSPLLI